MEIKEKTHIIISRTELFKLVEEYVENQTCKKIKIEDHSVECRTDKDGNAYLVSIFKCA